MLLSSIDATFIHAAGRAGMLLSVHASHNMTVSSRTANEHASAGNRARVTSMATMYSTTRPLMLLAVCHAGMKEIVHGIRHV